MNPTLTLLVISVAHPRIFVADSPTPTPLPGGAAQESITQAFTTLVAVGTGIALSVVAFMILWGGFKYMTARGNPMAMERAKTTLEHAGIGFGIVILCQVLANLLQSAIHV